MNIMSNKKDKRWLCVENLGFEKFISIGQRYSTMDNDDDVSVNVLIDGKGVAVPKAFMVKWNEITEDIEERVREKINNRSLFVKPVKLIINKKFNNLNVWVDYIDRRLMDIDLSKIGARWFKDMAICFNSTKKVIPYIPINILYYKDNTIECTSSFESNIMSRKIYGYVNNINKKLVLMRNEELDEMLGNDEPSDIVMVKFKRNGKSYCYSCDNIRNISVGSCVECETTDERGINHYGVVTFIGKGNKKPIFKCWNALGKI